MSTNRKTRMQLKRKLIQAFEMYESAKSVGDIQMATLYNCELEFLRKKLDIKVDGEIRAQH